MVPPPPYPAGPADLETKLDDKSRPLGACQVARNKPAVELGTLMKQTSAPGLFAFIITERLSVIC